MPVERRSQVCAVRISIVLAISHGGAIMIDEDVLMVLPLYLGRRDKAIRPTWSPAAWEVFHRECKALISGWFTACERRGVRSMISCRTSGPLCSTVYPNSASTQIAGHWRTG